MLLKCKKGESHLDSHFFFAFELMENYWKIKVEK